MKTEKDRLYYICDDNKMPATLPKKTVCFFKVLMETSLAAACMMLVWFSGVIRSVYRANP